MFTVTRKVEYALIGLAHIAGRPTGSIVTVREISEHYSIPGKLLAKIFHELKTAKLLRSHQGKNGGYSLARVPGDLSLAEIVDVVEGASTVVICCDDDGYNCPQIQSCNIYHPMEQLNHRLRGFLESVSLRDFVSNKSPRWASEN